MPHSISREEHALSSDFIHTLQRLLDFVEEVLPFINEQQYLSACNDLKSLHDIHDKRSVVHVYEQLVDNLRNNRFVRQHENRVKMKVKDKHDQLNDAQKLAQGFKVCKKCDRIVKDLSIHYFTDVCKRTYDTKRLSISSKQLDTAHLTEVTHRLRAWAIKWGKRKFYI
jgi:hypothetical protein